jgi:prepilin-type N-terminal cleavage/methylation domain-containing protein/prepilin-type processing-associated H-X9-DG protein
MRPQKDAFTLVELLVVIAIVSVLMTILVFSIGQAREHGKRIFCLTNMRGLTFAWGVYAEDNSGKIVSGQPGKFTGIQTDHSVGSDGWVNLLMPYFSNKKNLRCPTGEPGEDVTYAVVSYMNGYDVKNYTKSWSGVSFPQNITKKIDIKCTGAQAVFLDEGHLSTDSWTVYANKQWWWDQATARHGAGTNWSFADGHVEYRKWVDPRTLAVCNDDPCDWQGKVRYRDSSYAYQPGNNDLSWTQAAAWGRLYYAPTQ